jgi:hypothetical protein
VDISSLPVTELTSGAILVWILEQLKKLPWAQILPSWAYRVISIIWAIVSTLIVGRLTLPQTVFPQHSQATEVGIDVWFAASQFVIQEVVYRLAAGKSSAAPEPSAATGPAAKFDLGPLPDQPKASGKKQ